MSMGLGPVYIDISLEPGFNQKEAEEVLADLQRQLPLLESGSDTRMIVSMIIGALDGQIKHR